MTPGGVAVALILLPLLAAALIAPLPRPRAALAHGIGAAMLAVCTALAAWMVLTVVPAGTVVQGPHATWLELGTFALGVGTYVDPMGAVMALIVCALATAVVVYNAWYMHGDPLAKRFPWQLCFFAAAMLGVVLSDNLFLSFVCWELVGLGSYLLIGFWFAKPAAIEDPEYQRDKGTDARGVNERRLSPSHAQLKAFVMNRIGDAGFLIGLGLLIAAGVAAGVHEPLTWQSLAALHGAPLTLAALCVFCGAVAKSAQFPLHPWLPDAMQGPTTASSLIHAATMVAAGVFLVARAYPLFPPDALSVVGWTGGVTCLLAAGIACVQWDLKAVLAYSTVSQLGLMFVALGAGFEAGGRAAGMAHLCTHAFSKCLLFLCAGAVIHACGGLQDLARLGGLRKRMPWTAAASLLGVLALSGVPLASGFYSKDAVLAAALAHAQEAGALAWGPFVLACAGSLLTAAYLLRWWLRIFTGGERAPERVAHAHDPARGALIALVVLVPFTLALPWTFGGWLDTALDAPPAHHGAHGTALVIAQVLLVLGAGTAVLVYWWLPRRGVDAAGAIARGARTLRVACAELLGIDRAWNALFTAGARTADEAARVDLGTPERLAGLEAGTARAADLGSLDGLVDGIGRACSAFGRAGSRLHAGRLSVYIAAAAVVAAAGMLIGWLR